jgi:hypothetical protein
LQLLGHIVHFTDDLLEFAAHGPEQPFGHGIGKNSATATNVPVAKIGFTSQ